MALDCSKKSNFIVTFMLPVIAIILLFNERVMAFDGQEDLARKLASNERSESIAAARTLLVEQQISKETARAILEFARRELRQAIVPQRRIIEDRPVEELPKVGDETSLVRVKAKPEDFLDREFIVSGVIKVSDYFNFGYHDADSSHFSIELEEVGDNGLAGSEAAHLYVTKLLGQALLDDLAAVEEKGFTGKAARVTVTLESRRFEGASTWDLLEVVDWQFLTDDRANWKPGAFEGVRLSTQLLHKVGRDAVPTLLEGVTLAAIGGGPEHETVATAVRDISRRALFSMDKKSQRVAITRLRILLKKVKDPNAKAFGEETYQMLRDAQR